MTTKRYRIVVGGTLSKRFGDAFALRGVDVVGNVTVLKADIVDQAQLYGLLDGLRNLGLELVRVEEVPG